MYEIILERPSPQAIEEKGMNNWPIWQKEVSDFGWEYGAQETCLILEGKATVSGDECNTVSFGAGDMVIFPKGLKCKWTITEPVKKHYSFE